MGKVAPFTVTKSHKDGHVGIRVALYARDWPRASITMQATTNVSTADARELAAALIRQVDAEDAKVAKKQEADERRRKWRDREVAAGRMKVFSPAEFFGKRP